MLKRFIFFFFIISIIAQVNVSANQDTYTCENEKVLKQLLPNLFQEQNSTISRGDCVTSLMKILGVDNTTAARYADADYYAPVFLD